MTLACSIAGFLAGCQHDVAGTDSAFYPWDGRRMHCAIDIDTSARNSLASIETGLDRARDRGEVVELFAHAPGGTIEWSAVEAVFAAARARNLSFITYADLAHGIAPTAGLAFSFDDWHVKQWVSGRDLFARYHARLTFFVAHYDRLQPVERDGLRQLAADGHDIESHTISHLRGPVYVEDNGLEAYLAKEVQPSIDLLRNDGYEITSFAYPFGARTGETDRAIFDRVQLIRSVAYTWTGPEVDPCPF